eukprot:CAMPEP_0197656254 /NCGR_PEP_ID=MMETSP1338-20131121/41018_1 /TAXON_ID=43686 ORGANISM="Pelagodinium beii, Strain RCC1491" /NCGR_SAMPLE_ID=MMETSP1338 /ASSEMBLY_ACC=CAM_ASM_000754 /LENGTH=325 /DNA_ID=CAMNT_0043232167 /DNA_START=43 /DNA_END=1020 /DNA_ORIENTATION=+
MSLGKLATLKGSASSLKAAGAATLKGDFTDGGYLSKKTMRLSGAGNMTLLPNKNATMLKNIDTVFDEDHQKADHAQKKKLKSLANKVDKMAGVFEEETRARQEQRVLMDELHEDQMRRLDEIGAELDAAMAELAAYISKFMERFRTELKETFATLHSELTSQVDRLTPRLAALEARGRVLRAAIDEERQERIRHYSDILVPVKAQISKLEEGLEQEKSVREARAEEIQLHMVQAVEALETALEAEIAARVDRQEASHKEWHVEMDRLNARQERLEGVFDECIRGLNEEADQEHDARTVHQDPVVEELTKFMAKFHADVQEKAEMG